MYVGVIPQYPFARRNQQSIPHVCGGDPDISTLDGEQALVFPMYVGVIRA